MKTCMVLTAVMLCFNFLGFAAQKALSIQTTLPLPSIPGKEGSFISPPTAIRTPLINDPVDEDESDWDVDFSDDEPSSKPITRLQIYVGSEKEKKNEGVELLTRSECERKGDREASLVTNEEWIKKTQRDTELWRKLYNIANDSLQEESPLNQELPNQMYRVIVGNTKVLSSEMRLEKTKVTPIVACACLVSRAHNMLGNGSILYKQIFYNILRVDTDNGRRVCALRHFVKSGNLTLIRGFMGEKVDISQNPEVVTDLIKRYCAKIESVPVEKEESFFKGLFKLDVPVYTLLPQQNRGCARRAVFRVPNYSEQINALAIANLLVGQDADVSGLSDNFPPLDHAKKCVSCYYLRNYMFDKRAGLHSGKDSR